MDTFTAMDITDGFLTYYYSSTLHGEQLDYLMNNKKLIYDNFLTQIMSDPAMLFTAALCIDASVGIRHIYTFPSDTEIMNIEIKHSTLTDILPNPLTQEVRTTYVTEYFNTIGAPCKISNDYFTIYEKTEDSYILHQHLNETDMVELVIDAFMEETPGCIVDLVCLWLEKGFCISYVDEYNDVGERNYISFDKLKETYLNLYPISLHELNLVDKSPKFSNGDINTFSEWVNTKLVYPQEAMENGIQGRVILTFKVGEDGYIKDIKIVGNPNKLLAKEAIRVVSSSPKWTPGIKDNKNVSVSYTFPVLFQLE